MKVRPVAILGALLLPVFVSHAEPAAEPEKKKSVTPSASKEAMKHRIEELRKMRDQWFNKHHGGKMEGRPGSMNDEKRSKLPGLKERIEELHKAGKHEEANALRDKLAGELMEQRKHPQKPVAEGPSEGRLEHLGEAIKHLRAAGMHDVASNLEKAAAQMREQLHASKHPGVGKDEIHALREQVEKLQHAVEELRGQMRQAAPQEDVRKPANP